MAHFWKRLIAEQDGATMVEYALMIALIGASLVAVVKTLATATSSKFTSVSSTISGSGS